MSLAPTIPRPRVLSGETGAMDLAPAVPVLVGLVTVVGSLGGVLIAQRGERRRLDAEKELREADRDHEHRGRLQDVRLEAYRKFSAAFIAQSRQHEAMSLALAHQNTDCATTRGRARTILTGWGYSRQRDRASRTQSPIPSPPGKR